MSIAPASRLLRVKTACFAFGFLTLIAAATGCGSGPNPAAPDRTAVDQSSTTANPLQQIQFTGKIAAISGNAPGASLTVAGRTVRTTTDTVVRRRGDPVPFNRLAVGQGVEVQGLPQSNGDVLATRITIEDEAVQPVQEIEFTGTITALTGNASIGTLVVAGRTVRTNASTVVRRRGDPVPFNRLAVGQTVEVNGTPQPDASVLATRITIEAEVNVPPPAPPVEQEVEFEGVLTSLSGNAAAATLIVGGRTVQTDAATEFRRKGSGTSHVTFDALRVGQRLEVKGRQRGSSTVFAQRVTIDN